MDQNRKKPINEKGLENVAGGTDYDAFFIDSLAGAGKMYTCICGWTGTPIVQQDQRKTCPNCSKTFEP